MNRRNFIKNAAGILIAAPMVVNANSIMRIQPLLEDCSLDIHASILGLVRKISEPDWTLRERILQQYKRAANFNGYIGKILHDIV